MRLHHGEKHASLMVITFQLRGWLGRAGDPVKGCKLWLADDKGKQARTRELLVLGGACAFFEKVQAMAMLYNYHYF